MHSEKISFVNFEGVLKMPFQVFTATQKIGNIVNFVLLKVENILDISIREFKFNSKLYGKYEFALKFIQL